MPVRLLPVYLEESPQPSFARQLDALRAITGEEPGVVEWLEPVPLANAGLVAASAVVVPDMSGVAYRSLAAFRAIDVPIMIVTSEFGTVSMWDWEIRDFLRQRGVETIAPTSRTEFFDLCRALGAKKRLSSSVMLAYLDNLGAGKQPDIFKRFFWWEDECVDLMRERWGIAVQRRSYKDLWQRALSLPDRRVEEALNQIESGIVLTDIAKRARIDAVRMKLALSDELDETPDVIAAGINCLNESATSTTTPCLAWSLLFEERGLIWGCEADLTSMITKFLIWESLRTPVMMTNLYPFLMGNAALKHERIPYFPEVVDPQDHILAAHCGYFGIVPRSWSTTWSVKPRVLEIVDPNAHALDARFPEGDLTIVKIDSTLSRLTVAPALLTNYEQYENSDCLNGAVLKVHDGFRFVEQLPSHHAVLAVGDITRRTDQISRLLGLNVSAI